jgi:hypothetical protein
MIDFITGIAVGAACAPFWIMVYNTYVKPIALGIIAKIKTPKA